MSVAVARPAVAADALLEIDAITLAFGGVKALDGVAFRVAEGSITSIIGPNGAGKTSLFNTISGFYRPASGSIRFEGRDITRVAAPMRAALGLARMGFDDGNRRNSISASLTERFVTGPVYKLDVTAALYGSSNSRDNAPYFNPRNDRALGFTLDNQWLAWRFYRASWRHRLVLTMGSYRQSGFGSGNYGAIRYETAWAPSDLFELLLGVARSWHPYDGVRETRNGLYGSMNWRF